MKTEIFKFWQQVKFHGGILLRGFCRVLNGTMTAGLVALAVFGFGCVSLDAGYSAVIDFGIAIGSAWLALFNMYCIGLKKRGGKK